MSEHDDRLVRRVVRAAGGRDAAEACPDAERLGLYAERALDDDERPLVEAHVAACGRCQATIAAFVRSAPDAVAAAPGWGAGAVEGTGAAEPQPTWWLGWKWLMPVAATAAVITLAVWVQRPAAPGVAVEEEQAPEAGPMRKAEARRPEAAASTPEAAQSAAAERELAASGGSGRVAQGVAAPVSAAPGQRDVPRAAAAPPAAPVEASRLARQTATAARAERADSSGQTAAELQKAAAPTSATRAEAASANPPTTAAAAGARPVGALADAREPAVPAAPAPETAARFRAAESDAARAARPAENREADRADAAAPASAKAVASRETTAVGASGVGAVALAAKRPAQLTGRVTYRTRAALPAGAAIDVQLLDVSRMDAPAVVLGRVAIVTRGEQVPVPFVVGYDADAIDPRRRYTVQATITIEGRVAYRTTTAHTVLTNGAPSAAVEVVVEPMR